MPAIVASRQSKLWPPSENLTNTALKTSHLKCHLIKYNSKCLMIYHIKYLKCPPLADTHACSRLRWSLTALSMTFSGKAEQINWSAFLNSGNCLWLLLQFVIRLHHFFLPKPDNPVDWGWVNWRQLIINDEVRVVWIAETWNGKNDTGTLRKINTVLLNIKISRLKLESKCGYKLAINW